MSLLIMPMRWQQDYFQPDKRVENSGSIPFVWNEGIRSWTRILKRKKLSP